MSRPSQHPTPASAGRPWRFRAALASVTLLALLLGAALCRRPGADVPATARLVLIDVSATTWEVAAEAHATGTVWRWTLRPEESVTAELPPGIYTLTQTLVPTQEPQTLRVRFESGEVYRWSLATVLRPDERLMGHRVDDEESR